MLQQSLNCHVGRLKALVQLRIGFRYTLITIINDKTELADAYIHTVHIHTIDKLTMRRFQHCAQRRRLEAEGFPSEAIHEREVSKILVQQWTKQRIHVHYSVLQLRRYHAERNGLKEMYRK